MKIGIKSTSVDDGSLELDVDGESVLAYPMKGGGWSVEVDFTGSVDATQVGLWLNANVDASGSLKGGG